MVIHSRYFIGDLHARPWPVFPTTPEGQNGYLARLEGFLGVALPEIINRRKQETGVELESVTFLGDIGDEPYLRGKVTIAAVQAVRAGLEKLRDKIPTDVDVYLLAGNHDLLSVGGSWLEILSDLVDVIERPEVIDTRGRPLALVPYLPSQTEMFQAVAAMPDDALLAGHFVYDGARYDNGEEWAAEACVPKDQASRFWLSVLGHAHVPREADRIVYAGTPLPYSWAMKGVRGSIIEVIDDGTDAPKFGRLAVPGPVFLGPVTPKELKAEKAVPAGSFVRLLVPSGDHAAVDRAREEFPTLRISAEFAPPKEETQAPRLDLSALEASTAKEARVAGLKAYIEHVGKTEALPMDEEELLALGAELLGEEAPNE